MENTLIRTSDKDGEIVNVDEDMTPTAKSLVVLDWLDVGLSLVEHVHCPPCLCQRVGDLYHGLAPDQVVEEHRLPVERV